jgi:hypothetical protein
MTAWPPTDLASERIEVAGNAGKWAALSRCGRYRFLLGRAWDEPDAGGLQGPFGFWKRPICVWVMLNPSTADHAKDDPTIRKCIGFAERLGCGGILVANLFAWRATDPNDLVQVIEAGREDPVGWCNDAMLDRVSALQPLLVGWGKPKPAFRARAERVWSLGLARSWPMMCVGVNDDGSPRHPLFVPYEVQALLLRQARDNLRAGMPHGLPPSAARAS